MFRGEYPVTIDDKGRFAFPARYRQALREACGGQMVATVHWDGCLLIYPQPNFQAFERKLLSAAGGLEAGVRKVQRFFLGRARDIELDKQGRMTLPGPLREHAELDSKAVLVGMVDCWELWDEAAWQGASAGFAEDFDPADLPEKLRDLSLFTDTDG